MRRFCTGITLRKAAEAFRKNEAEIFAAASVLSTVLAVVSAIRETPKAVELIGEKKKELGKEKLSVRETVTTALPVYIPTIVLTTASVGFSVASCARYRRVNAALASTGAAALSAVSELRDATKELVGEEKAKEICDKVTENLADRPSAVTGPKSAIVQGDKHEDDVECWDTLFGSRFWSTRDKIERAVNGLNDMLNRHGNATLNDFYWLLGIDTVEIGDFLGWNLTADGLLKLEYSSLLKDARTPILTINYARAPHYDC